MSVSALLPVCAPVELPERASERRWLVESIWPAAGVGIIGGAPKSLKTWMALDLAVSVATGTPALGAYACAQAGRALVYAAEDSLPDLRERLVGIAHARGVDFGAMDLGVITCDHLHLDRDDHLGSLETTLAAHEPALLVLDPFVRLHRGVDENSAADVSRVLGALRMLQRRFGTAIALVHHARKNVRGMRFGQALRGSTDFHAWGDVMLYLHRDRDGVQLTVEHRSAASPEPVRIELAGKLPALRLSEGSSTPSTAGDLATRIVEALTDRPEPMSQNRLRGLVRARKSDVGTALRDLAEEGRLERTPAGWLLAEAQQTSLLD